jgi:hypothetical protein
MRTILAALVILAAASAADRAMAEVVYPWCRQAGDGSVNCGFSSQQQCLDASVGKSAFCLQNPRYQSSSGGAASRKRQSR